MVVGGRAKASKYPFLVCKAAQGRHLVPFVTKIAVEILQGKFAFTKQRLKPISREYCEVQVRTMRALLCYHEVCSMDPFDKATCKAALYEFLQGSKQLHDILRRPEVVGIQLTEIETAPMGWRCRPKMHMLHHLAEGPPCNTMHILTCALFETSNQ